ncbi:MAG: dipeptide/oligopeptide/nickel ABC transporter permease/ATP-binding protein [Alphaproteobacteria bacterium]|nr:dipeptide/oligopeptide/nickel ABC transporter permease/ATP-binding protein [Alphaproteobacteria bacterium]
MTVPNAEAWRVRVATALNRRLGSVVRSWRGLAVFDRVILAGCGFVLFLTVFGPWLTPHPTMIADPLQRLKPPAAGHWFGTDENGIDVFSRLLAAPRTDVSIALIATAMSVAIGATLGVFAGYFEGSERRLLRWGSEGGLRLLDVLQAFPVFVLAMVLVAIRGTGPINVLLAIAFVNFPVFLRLVRSEVLSLRERPFAEAAAAAGNSDLGLCFKHLLPNTFPTILVQVSVTVGFAVLLTAGLSFVGAGVSPPTPELGAMIASGAKFMILGQWWVVVFPGLALGIVVFTFAMTGEIVGQLMEPGRVVPPARRAPVSGGTAATQAAARPVAKDAVLAVRNLRVDAIDADSSQPALAGVDLDLAPGEILGVVGPPGAGKSVLVRAVVGLLGEKLRRVDGEVLFRGTDLTRLDADALRQIRGRDLVPLLANAKAQLNPLVRVGDLMTAHIRAHAPCSRKAARARAAVMLRMIGIADPERRLDAYPHELSGGMAQRVCLAIALVHRPSLIVADEPTAGLDVTVQRQVLDLMIELCRQSGAAQVLATRDLGIVAQYCRRVAVMYEGRVVETGPVEQVLLSPSHEATRALVRAANIASVVAPLAEAAS